MRVTSHGIVDGVIHDRYLRTGAIVRVQTNPERG